MIIIRNREEMKRFYFWRLGILVLVFPLVLFAKEGLKPAEVIIGLGAGPAQKKDGSINKELKARVEKVVELYQAGLADYIIFTGGETGGGCEAEAMKELAVKMGVPGDKIFLESQAIDTITNAKYSIELMKEQGFKTAILVSNPYHLVRAKWLFNAYPGLEFQSAGARSSKNLFYDISLISYEALAWFSYIFREPREKLKPLTTP